MAAKRLRARILRGVMIFLAGLLFLLLAQPLWFPWILRPLAQRYGISYANSARKSYGRLVLNDVSFTNRTARFHAEKAEMFIPTAWLWHRWLRREQVPYLRVDNWKLDFGPGPRGARPQLSVYTNVVQVASTLAKIKEWIPKAILTNGIIQIPVKVPAGFGFQIGLPAVVWVNGTLSAEAALPAYDQRASLHAELGTAPYQLMLDSKSLDLHSDLRLSEDSNGLQLQSTNLWLQNRIQASARFGRQGLLPEQASLRSETFTIPAKLLGLQNFEDVTGSLTFQWEQNHFSLIALTAAQPERTSNLPPLDVQIRASGNTESAFIQAATISSPWLQAQLSPGTAVQFVPPFFNENAALKVALDLARQPWFPAHGKLDGQVVLCPAWGKFPTASFLFSGMGIGVSNFQTKTLELQGEFLWPWLDISRFMVTLPDSSRASLTGQLDVQKQIVVGGQLSAGGTLGRQFLGSSNSFERASIDLSFSGPARNLSHFGQINLTNFTAPHVHPLRLQAEWRGEGLNLRPLRIVASAQKSSLEFEGALLLTNHACNVFIQSLSLQQNRQPVFALDMPSRLSLQWPQTNALPRPLSLELDSLHWRGAGRELTLSGQFGGAAFGKLAGTVNSLDLSLFADFLQAPVTANKIDHLELSAEWNQGPLNFALRSAASLTREGVRFSGEAALKGNGQGILIERLAVAGEAQPIVTAHGFLPLIVTPMASNSLHFLPGQSLRFEAMTQTNSVFWNEIAAQAGVALVDPRLTVNVSGAWQSPQGKVEMEVKRIELVTKKEPARTALADFSGLGALRLENVQLALELDRQTARVQNLSLLIAAQPATLTGQVALGKDFWAALERGRFQPDWEKCTARLAMEDAQVAALAPLLPKVLRPEGRLNLQLALFPGARLEGELELAGAGTRPLAGFGMIRDIGLKLKFLNQGIDLRSLTASVGGAPVSASGKIDLHGKAWLKGALPPFQITVKGDNVPLARNPDFIVRSDLNIIASNSLTGPVVLTGGAHLRDSFYLHDLKDLLPGGLATPAHRPPYFSIEAKPFADWRLDLALQAGRFLKVNSPLFRGLLSADLRLTGTLKEPIALGELKIDSGVVQFPFGNLDVTQGFVTLTSENPYRPQLLVNATARTAGYDIRMELTGPADQPVIQFSSTPPLSSDQITLMLTAGQMPRHEYSLSPEQRAGKVAFFLGKNLLSQFGLGEQSERLTIRTGENISETGVSTYDVEYKLNKHWSLVGERDQFNAFNFGLRWKIYSK